MSDARRGIALYVDGEVDLDATLDDVEAAVRALNGAEHSLVVLELPSGKTVTLGGGPDRFVAEVAASATERWCAVNPRAAAGTVTLVMGGDVVEPPARLCIDRTAALEAALTFASQDGALSRRLPWSRQT
jgi:hypothetical protein